MIIIPESDRFPAWDFIHYSVRTTRDKDLVSTKRTVTFVQTTISEGETTQSGLWTIDPKHKANMIRSLARDRVVGRVLQALGVECSVIGCQSMAVPMATRSPTAAHNKLNDSDEEMENNVEQFLVLPTNKDDKVQFFLVTACPLPTRTGKPVDGKTKFDLRNLLVIHRAEVEQLGVVLLPSDHKSKARH